MFMAPTAGAAVHKIRLPKSSFLEMNLVWELGSPSGILLWIHPLPELQLHTVGYWRQGLISHGTLVLENLTGEVFIARLLLIFKHK